MTSILLVRLGALGDVVHAMPVVAALRQKWPAARIDWLVDPRYVEVVKLVEGVSHAIPFDPRGLLASGTREGTLATLGDLRHEQYDVVFDLQGLVKSATAARLAGGGQTIGFSSESLREPAARFFYTNTVDVPTQLHVIQKNLTLLTAVGVPVGEARVVLNLQPSQVVQQITERFGERGYVALNPGAAWPNKRWPAARFGEVAARVQGVHGVPALVVWGPGEEALAQDVVAASQGAAQLAPATSIVDLFGVFRAAKLAIAGDTGPLHIAVAVGTPVVALFGPTYPERNGPWRTADISLSRAAQCECHYQRQCLRASPCIDEISVDDVVRAAGARLVSASGGVRE